MLPAASLGAKLSLALTASLGLVVAAALFGMAQLHGANRHLQEIEEVWSPRIELLRDLRLSWERTDLLATRQLQTSNVSHLAEIEAAQRRTAADMDAVLPAFAETAVAAEEQRLLAVFAGLVADWRATQASIARHLAAGDVGPATLLFDSQLRVTFARADATLAELTQFARNAQRAAVVRAGDAYAEALARALVATGLGALLALAVVAWVRRHIGAPMLDLATAVRRLAAGDLSSTPASTRRHDEIGTLAAAVESYRASLLLSRNLAGAEKLQRERLQAAVANMPVGLCMFDGDGRLIVSNARFLETYGLDATTLGHRADLRQIMRAAPHFPAQGAPDEATAGAQQRHDRIELPDGRVISVIRAALPDGGWVATHEDMTERCRAEAQISFLAHHDTLTGLPNRVQFREKIAEAVAQARRGSRFAVLFLDLDRFKWVNDTLGHPAGDALLKAVAERLRANTRETDLVARLGGDEFALIQPGIHRPADAAAMARMLVKVLGTPFEIDGHQVVIGTSIGIALLPSDGDDADLVLRNADLALYRAKADGRGTWRFFEPDMDAAMQVRRQLELELRRALVQGEFDLFYQPIVDLRAREVSGYEALLRWRHPERGIVPPSDFIPLAEEIGLIVPIGEWVLHRACREAIGWPEHLKLAVNLSAAQFVGAGPAQAVAAALAATGLAAARLELEITETVVLSDTDRTLRMLHELKALGVSVVMDDFGAGFSSLAYLRKFPFDRVKIDRSFVGTAEEARAGGATARAIADLCESLGMQVTAEGIETEAQLAPFQGRSMDVQGYLFGQPRPASTLHAADHLAVATATAA